jgi:hypothetical protein
MQKHDVSTMQDHYISQTNRPPQPVRGIAFTAMLLKLTAEQTEYKYRCFLWTQITC